jgi:hypothetical protein
VKIEEQQRVFGLIPNFYVAYDRNAVPLTAKLKFKLALKVATDPITAVGIVMLSGIQQAETVLITLRVRRVMASGSAPTLPTAFLTS